MQQVTTYYLEMKSADSLLEKNDANGLLVMEAEIDEFRFNKFLYTLIGGSWQWTDKLALSDDEWRQYVENPQLRTWVGYVKGAIAGYFELHADAHGNTEIIYFGLAENFIGKGLGSYFLSKAIKSAWAMPNTTRVWVHTCSLDHPAALSNYQRRGFKVYKTEIGADQ
ncbi:MAG: ribosomal protein S18 acetylase RimI-like enzyme [Arenicella sp.]|jgi:ribosomal protein S18 acetylase RimI-like enzyme